MKWRYFLFQLKAFLVNPKNVGLFIITIVLSLYFGLVSVPNHTVIEQVDPRPIQKNILTIKPFLKQRVRSSYLRASRDIIILLVEEQLMLYTLIQKF
ncbi:hypothetical protein SDC49_04000 [Lactobacillus sp. R2/2]|nr:hypothetical protein [Lactobacillus sp. R2/2]